MTTVDVINRIVDATPEQRLAAAMLVDAREACHRGCSESCEWLQRRGLAYLLVIGGDRNDVDILAARLLPPDDLQLRLGV